MTADLKSLFHGIAIVIDDKVGVQEETPDLINQIVAVIEDENCHVLKLQAIPTEKQAKNFIGASFFILDWEFNPISAADAAEGVIAPAHLKKQRVKNNINFIKQINESQFIPIFIFTSEDIDTVTQELRSKGLLSDNQGDHIYVKSKREVLDSGLFETMESWIKTHPSAYAFKKWEAAYSKAKDSLFKEFYKSSRLWPLIIWKTHKSDNTIPSVELGKLISRNIESRTSPIDFDESILSLPGYDLGTVPVAEIKGVLAGERLIQNDFLSSQHITTGDIFKKGNDYFINIRPECDCISREGNPPPDLYLLKGELKGDAWTASRINASTKELMEQHNEALIFSAYKSKTLSFRFKEIKIVSQTKLQEENYTRIGRLIPPFLTRLLQRYAAYCHRPGIPRIPDELVPQQQA